VASYDSKPYMDAGVVAVPSDSPSRNRDEVPVCITLFQSTDDSGSARSEASDTEAK
jgi:hypothetical protein